MKCLFFHCKEYKISVEKLATRPKTVSPEEIKEKTQKVLNCVVALITIESKDSIDSCSGLFKEINIMCKDVGRKEVVILPFAHLSNDLAKSQKALEILDFIASNIKDKTVWRSHFGSHKSLLLDVYGHTGNVRFREF